MAFSRDLSAIFVALVLVCCTGAFGQSNNSSELMENVDMLNSTNLSEANCRSTCNPPACLNLTCPNFKATCVMDVCNCNARFTIFRNVTELLDITDLCIGKRSYTPGTWTLPNNLVQKPILKETDSASSTIEPETQTETTTNQEMSTQLPTGEGGVQPEVSQPVAVQPQVVPENVQPAVVQPVAVQVPVGQEVVQPVAVQPAPEVVIQPVVIAEVAQPPVQISNQLATGLLAALPNVNQLTNLITNFPMPGVGLAGIMGGLTAREGLLPSQNDTATDDEDLEDFESDLEEKSYRPPAESYSSGIRAEKRKERLCRVRCSRNRKFKECFRKCVRPLRDEDEDEEDFFDF